MSDETKQLERLKRIAKEYTGTEDLKALSEHPDYKTQLSLNNGDSELAIAAMSIRKSKDQAINGHFICDRSGTSRKKKEPWAASLVLFPDGDVKMVGNGGVGGQYLQQSQVSGVTVTKNIGAGTTSYRTGDSTTVSLTTHDSPIPEVTLTQALKDARMLRKFGDGKNKLIRGKVKDVFFTGTIYQDEDRGTFVRQPEGQSPGSVSIIIQDGDGNQVQSRLTPEVFQTHFGFDPFEDTDITKETLAGRQVRVFGEVDILANLPDEKAKDYETEFGKFVTEHCGTDDQGKLHVKERSMVGPYMIEDVYVGDDGAVFSVDCSVLGYSPRVSFEHRTGNKNGRDWEMGVGYNIQFVGVTPGQRSAPKEYSGIGALLQKQIEGA